MSLGAKRCYLVLAMLFVVILLYSPFLLWNEIAERLAAEDGPIEDFGAVCLLLGSVLCFLTYAVSGRPKRGDLQSRVRRNVWYLLLGLFLFACLGEEISWGQRMLGISTPETVARYNRQGELNLHNLKWFHGMNEADQEKDFVGKLTNTDRLFSVIWLGFCVIVPLAHRYTCRFRNLIDKVRLPVPSVHFAYLFPLTYLIHKALLMRPATPFLHRGVVETKEAIFEFLYLCVAIGLTHQVFRMRIRMREPPTGSSLPMGVSGGQKERDASSARRESPGQ